MYSTTHEEIRLTLQEIISRELGHPLDDLRDDTEIATLPGIESIKILRMVTRIEQRYRIELQDNVVFQLRTFGELRDLVVVKQGKAQDAGVATRPGA